jgi:predicted  nucleic acid-binding Zn-ribbon protein
MALGIIPNASDSASKAFTDLKANLDEEKATQLTAQTEVNVLSQAVKDLKISADRFSTHIPTLEGKVKHLENKVVDGLNEVRAQELCLEHTTRANDDYQK